MKKYTITVNGTAYEVEVEEAGVVASAPKAAPKAAPAPAAAPAPKAAPAPAPKAAAPVAAVQLPFPLLCRAMFCPLA